MNDFRASREHLGRRVDAVAGGRTGADRVPANQSICGISDMRFGADDAPGMKSSMHTPFGKPLLYPLSYGGATQKRVAAAVVQLFRLAQLGGRIAGVSLNEWNRSCMKCAVATIRTS
jgi:hypothetical protein